MIVTSLLALNVCVLFSEGSGGKWTWGKANRLYEEPEDLDPKDPNYDSDVAAPRNIRYQSITPELGEAMMEKYVEPILLEFFENDDLDEAVVSSFLD